MIRTLALALGALNLLGNVATALFVIYAQEVLGTSTTAFAILGTASAVGGLIGGWAASAVTRRLGAGTCLSVSVVVFGLMTIVVGLVSSWLLAAAFLSIGTFFIVVWNVITVSFRQSVIPEHLLGRVNSVYRFFGWGAIPIGALIGGGMVAVLDGPLDRDAALARAVDRRRGAAGRDDRDRPAADDRTAREAACRRPRRVLIAAPFSPAARSVSV